MRVRSSTRNGRQVRRTRSRLLWDGSRAPRLLRQSRRRATPSRECSWPVQASSNRPCEPRGRRFASCCSRSTCPSSTSPVSADAAEVSFVTAVSADETAHQLRSGRRVPVDTWPPRPMTYEKGLGRRARFTCWNGFCYRSAARVVRVVRVVRDSSSPVSVSGLPATLTRYGYRSVPR